jgi:hypothetical protein
MILAAALYTALVVSLNVIAGGGGSNLYPPSLEGTFTQSQIQERIYGSKIVVVSEQAMLNLIYTVKSCMLVMYTRLTLGLATQRLVRHLALYVVLGWAASQVAFFAACRPFRGYWAMPPPDRQCATLERYAVVQAVFNISSDALMLFVPLPLVLRTTMPARQKAVLMAIFSMGLFVIVAALLTKVFNLSDVWDPSYMLWYVREASVAVYVSNLPMVWPLLREWFPCLSGLTPGGTSSGRKRGVYGSRGGTAMGTGTRTGTGNGREERARGRVNSLGSLDSAFDLEVGVKSPERKGKFKGEDSESTEQIVGAPEEVRGGCGDEIGIAVTRMGCIQVERTVEVHEERNGVVKGESGDYSVDVDVGVEWQRTRRMGDASRR